MCNTKFVDSNNKYVKEAAQCLECTMPRNWSERLACAVTELSVHY